MSTTILIDGDVLAYQYGAAAQRTGSFKNRLGHDVHFTYARGGKAIMEAGSFVENLTRTLDADRALVALSDLDITFRFEVWAGYKQNRKGVQRPLAFHDVRNYLIENYGARVLPRLEGDDVLGLWMGEARRAGEDAICCTIDKDLLTVPGKVYNWRKPKLGVVETDETQARVRHYYQTVTGDSVDGYPGAKGIGPKGAEKLLGEEPMWQDVLAAYASKKIDEDVALANARCAYILHEDGDYDFTTNTVRLWTPPPVVQGGEDQ